MRPPWGERRFAERTRRLLSSFGQPALSSSDPPLHEDKTFLLLLKSLSYLLPGAQKKVCQAYITARDAHGSQMRHSGEPYITHPVSVSIILAEMRMDSQTIQAGLLHDVLEDTDVDKFALKQYGFSWEVIELVDGVSKLTQIEFKSRIEAQAENFRKMLLAMSQDIRVVFIKLADRLHNMRTLGCLPPTKARRIARETLDIYSPIAKRLGMWEIADELESLSFLNLYPHRYAVLNAASKRLRGGQKPLLKEIHQDIEKAFKKAKIEKYKVRSRQKTLYSIYKKMRGGKRFTDITDVHAVRIIVQDVDTCYRALGVVHNLYTPVIENKFHDYIALPKANGYQSIHTVLYGPYGAYIEIQIRTEDMDEVANFGIAAHWLYESGINDPKLIAQKWVQNLLDIQRNIRDSVEFIKSVKRNLFPDEVYVFSPKGAIFELPTGATPVDFAYAIHTEIGDTCVSAKIDRRLVPLSTPLKNGQTVEIITNAYQRPEVAWLQFVVTSKAKNSIRHHLKNRKLKESIALGKALLNQELKRSNLSMRKLSNDVMEQLLNNIQLVNLNALLESIGLGHRPASLIVKQILHIHDALPDLDKAKTALAISRTRETKRYASKDEALIPPLSIRGTEGMVVQFSRCCCPLPYDAIRGVIRSGEGIVVHRENCSEIRPVRYNLNRCVPLAWDAQVQGSFLTAIHVEIQNEPGVLAMLTMAIAEKNGNIDDIKVENYHDKLITSLHILLFVKTRHHLRDIIHQVGKVKSVIKVTVCT